jgi:hypothetical protein
MLTYTDQPLKLQRLGLPQTVLPMGTESDQQQLQHSQLVGLQPPPTEIEDDDDILRTIDVGLPPVVEPAELPTLRLTLDLLYDFAADWRCEIAKESLHKLKQLQIVGRCNLLESCWNKVRQTSIRS